MNHEIRWNQNFSYGFDHGAGHPLRFLDDAKAPNCRKNNGFKDIGNYSEWPKVAGAVIKALTAVVNPAIHSADNIPSRWCQQPGGSHQRQHW